MPNNPKTFNEEDVMPALQSELQRTAESRYIHRLHGVLLVARGLSCREAASLLGSAPRTVAYWVHRFKESGPDGLLEAKRPGRPSKLTPEQWEEVARAVRRNPADFGLSTSHWDARALREFIAARWGVSLGIRQSQRFLRQRELQATGSHAAPRPSTPPSALGTPS